MHVNYYIPNYYSRLSYGICRIPATLVTISPACKNNTAYWYGNFHAKHPVHPFVNGWPPPVPPGLDNLAP
jgi:hypothetical protein